MLSVIKKERKKKFKPSKDAYDNKEDDPTAIVVDFTGISTTKKERILYRTDVKEAKEKVRQVPHTCR
jgi:hypothetical protein